METLRMWHSEIVLSRLVSLLLNKALHGVSSTHECSLSLSLCFSPSLSSLLPLPCTCHCSTASDPFSSLCILPPHLPLAFFFSLRLFGSFTSSPTKYPATDIIWKPLLSVWEVVLGSLWILLAISYLKKICWVCCCSLNHNTCITLFFWTN